MWTVKAKVMPLIIVATGTISKSFRKYPNNIRGNHGKYYQGTTENSHIGHCTHTAESTDVKVQNFSSWEITLHVPYIVTTE
jgi:hypothetical protein